MLIVYQVRPGMIPRTVSLLCSFSPPTAPLTITSSTDEVTEALQAGNAVIPVTSCVQKAEVQQWRKVVTSVGKHNLFLVVTTGTTCDLLPMDLQSIPYTPELEACADLVLGLEYSTATPTWRITVLKDNPHSALELGQLVCAALFDKDEPYLPTVSIR